MTASELDTLSILLAKARAPHLEPQPPSRG
jgi:hypothetical protein